MRFIIIINTVTTLSRNFCDK